MNSRTNSHAEHELIQLAACFEHWRQHRTSRAEPIPQSLWEQAVLLATVLPRSRVARQLRLSGQALKQRCVAHPPAASARSARATDPAAAPRVLDFVELPATPSWPPVAQTMEIELERPDGARLRLRCPESTSPVAALVRAFLEVVP